jgi:hypothetical protein
MFFHLTINAETILILLTCVGVFWYTVHKINQLAPPDKEPVDDDDFPPHDLGL